MDLTTRTIEIPTVEQIEPRLRLYGIDEDCRGFVRGFAPQVRRIIESTVVANIDLTKRHLPSSRATLEEFGPELTRALVSHFKVLFEARFDDEYLRSLERLLIVEFDSAIGVRARLQVGQQLVLPLLNWLTRRNPLRVVFGARLTPRDTDQLMRVLYFDLVCAIAVEQHETRRAVVERHGAISRSLEDFSRRTEEIIQLFDHSARELVCAARHMLDRSQATLDQSKEAESASVKARALASESADRIRDLLTITSDMGIRLAGAVTATTASVSHATDIKQSMSELADAIRQVTSIALVIRGITDQTNLLALNATIEAAHAGEAGKGFGVVAQEVKNLASQTGAATEAITAQFEKIVAATERCMDSAEVVTGSVGLIAGLNDQAAATYESQFGLAGDIAHVADSIAFHSSDVALGAQQSTLAMEDTIAAIGRVEKTALDLARSAESLKTMVSDLTATIVRT